MTAWYQRWGPWLTLEGCNDGALLANVVEALQPAVLVLPVRALDPDRPLEAGLLAAVLPLDAAPLPSTQGCETPEDAVATALLACELTGLSRVLIDVGCSLRPGGPRLPDVEGLLEACRALREHDLELAASCTSDPVICQRLGQLGCRVLLPQATPHALPGLVSGLDDATVVARPSGPTTDTALALIEAGARATLVGPWVWKTPDPEAVARSLALVHRAASSDGRVMAPRATPR